MPQPLEHESTNPLLIPWYRGLDDPEEAQAQTLNELLKGYAKTVYGREHGADSIAGLDEYRERFPKLGYPELKTLLEPVKRGDHASFLPEPPETWVI